MLTLSEVSETEGCAPPVELCGMLAADQLKSGMLLEAQSP